MVKNTTFNDKYIINSPFSGTYGEWGLADYINLLVSGEKLL
jgi:hypothetical protein